MQDVRIVQALYKSASSGKPISLPSAPRIASNDPSADYPTGNSKASVSQSAKPSED